VKTVLFLLLLIGGIAWSDGAGQSCPAIDFLPPLASRALLKVPHHIPCLEARRSSSILMLWKLQKPDSPAVQRSGNTKLQHGMRKQGASDYLHPNPQGAGNRPGRPHMASFTKSAITLALRYHIPLGHRYPKEFSLFLSL
jgi:hypothetical protein